MAKIKKLSTAELMARQLASTQSSRFQDFLANGSDQGKGAEPAVASGVGLEPDTETVSGSESVAVVEVGLVAPVVEEPAVEASASDEVPASVDEEREVVSPTGESESETEAVEKDKLAGEPSTDSPSDEVVEPPVPAASVSETVALVPPVAEPQPVAQIKSAPLVT